MGYVVIWDPKGELPRGTMLGDGQSTSLLAARGVLMLKAEADLVERNAVGSYFLRDWGKGQTFDGPTAQRRCPMIVHATPDRHHVEWIARLIPHGSALQDRHGHLRLTTNSAQPQALAGGFSQLEEATNLASLGNTDTHGGWTLRGTGRLTIAAEGYVGLSLYGIARGVACVWSAVSVSR